MKTPTKWTPSPWRDIPSEQAPDGYSYSVVDSDGLPVADIPDALTGDEANARLIALAPEMAEALATLVKGADLNNATLQRDIGDAILQARALLARMEGNA